MGKKATRCTKRTDRPQRRSKAIKQRTDGGEGAGGDDDDQQQPEIALLSEELKEGLEGGGYGGNPLVIIPKRSSGSGAKRKLDARGQAVEDEVLEYARKMTKRQRKRFQQIQDRKEKAARRGEIYQKLEEQRISEEQQKLLRSSKSFGQKKEGMKVRLARVLELQRAGLPVLDHEAAELLLREVEVAPTTTSPIPPPTAGATTTKVEEGSKVASDGQRRRRKRSKQKRKEVVSGKRDQGHGGASRQAPSSSSSDDDDDDSDSEEEATRQEVARLRQRAAEMQKQLQPTAIQGHDKGGKRKLDIVENPIGEATMGGMEKSEEEAEEEDQDEEEEDQSDDQDAMQESSDGDEGGEDDSDSGSEEEGSEEDDEEQEEEASEARGVTGAAAGGGGGGGGFAAMMMAQLSKLEEKTAPKESTTPASSIVKEGSLEGLDWAAFLDAVLHEITVAGDEAETAANNPYANRPKYVPQEIKLMTPASAGYIPSVAQEATQEGPSRYELVDRPPELQAARMALPVCGMEQEIVESISQNLVVVLCGETGSGKSTQVPQFLYEYGYARHGMIGVTQPRRVAAVSTAQRVAYELQTACGRGGRVAYQIRYDNRGVTEDTKVKFMTDGILLQEISKDLLLRQYSVILLDEAHERNLNTDILLGLLSRAIPLRAQLAKEQEERFKQLSEVDRAKAKPPLQPLRLIIMSATLRVEDFTLNKRLFPQPPPVIRVDARQHPVSLHFNKRTVLGEDYVQEAFRKTCKIHRRLPEGGILVFLTGKGEILHLCRLLREEFGAKKKKHKKKGKAEAIQKREEGNTEDDFMARELDDDEEEADLMQEGKKDDYEEDSSNWSDEAESDDEEEGHADKDKEGEEGIKVPTTLGKGVPATVTGDEAKGEEEEEKEGDSDLPPTVGPVHVLPLFAMLTPQEQSRVFQPPPSGHRLIVVATNVAETSLTIPGIKYVVDSGRVKQRLYDTTTGMAQFSVRWVSQASADQRAGRAGRTGPGHCYRLYSSAVYSQRLEKFTDPEILSMPLEDVVLQMKAMGIQHLDRFPFPTPPESKALEAANDLLTNLGALDPSTLKLTPLGRAIASFPIGARFAKMLVLGRQANLLDYTVALVASLTERDPVLIPDAVPQEEKGAGDQEDDDDEVDEEELKLIRRKAASLRNARVKQWRHPSSDALARLRAAGAYTYVVGGQGQEAAVAFCRENMLHEPTMGRGLLLRKQLCRILNRRFERDPAFKPLHILPRMEPPTAEEEESLRQILLASHTDCVARLAPMGTVTTGSRILRQCAYLSCHPSLPDALYIHPTSSLFSPNPEHLPEFIIYESLTRSSRGTPYMTCVTTIHPNWIPSMATGSPLLSFSPPLPSPPPTYDSKKDTVVFYVIPRFGARAWELSPYAMPAAEIGKTRTRKGGKKDDDVSDDVYRWFARLLLEGKVCPPLRKLQQGAEQASEWCLNDPPAMITHKKPVRKVLEIVQPLREAGICTRAGLEAQWAQDKRFLRSAIQMWVKAEHVGVLKQVWAELVR